MTPFDTISTISLRSIFCFTSALAAAAAFPFPERQREFLAKVDFAFPFASKLTVYDRANLSHPRGQNWTGRESKLRHRIQLPAMPMCKTGPKLGQISDLAAWVRVFAGGPFSSEDSSESAIMELFGGNGANRSQMRMRT